MKGTAMTNQSKTKQPIYSYQTDPLYKQMKKEIKHFPTPTGNVDKKLRVSLTYLLKQLDKMHRSDEYLTSFVFLCEITRSQRLRLRIFKAFHGKTTATVWYNCKIKGEGIPYLQTTAERFFYRVIYVEHCLSTNKI